MAKRDEIGMLTKRVDDLELQLARLRQILEAAAPLLRNTNHLNELADQAGRLNQSAESRLRDLREQAAPLAIGKPRFKVEFNTVYLAETTGYVSMAYFSGTTGAAKIMAGPTDPPTEDVSQYGGEYVGGLIRRGEYWTVVSYWPNQATPSFNGVFTPLY